jgi:hypothetical protein
MRRTAARSQNARHRKRAWETSMNASIDMLNGASVNTARYARCIKASKKGEWDIDRDVLRGRKFDFEHKFLPDGLCLANELGFLSERERRTLSQVQGRTYAYLFGLVERFISAKMIDQSREHCLGDQVALEAMIRFGDEEVKHQELFRRVEELIAPVMPGGYSTVADANEVARVVLSKSTWAVLALTCHIELFVQSHYEQSIDADASLSPLFRDIFKYHWQDECQHVVLDELEWRRVHYTLTPEERDAAVTDLIHLVAAVDGIVQTQSAADTAYFLRLCDRNFSDGEQRQIEQLVLKAYRWQYIVSGVKHRHFGKLLTEFTTPAQMERILQALAPIMN